MKVPALFNPDWLNKRDRHGHRRRDTIKVLAKTIVHDFLTFNVPHMAASIAFWGLFSMFPMVLAVIIITGDFLSYDAFIERIGEAVPVSQDFLTETLIDITNDWPYTGTAAVIGLVWASLSVFSAIRKGINAAWAIFKPRPFFRERVIDFSLLLGSWLIFIISLSLTPIIEFSRSTASIETADAWSGTWLLLTWGLPLLLTFTSFSTLYKFVPNTRVQWKDVWIAALIAAISFEVLRHGFVWYVARLSVYNLVYGTAATMVVLLAWAYFSGVILLFGAVVASRINKLRRKKQQLDADNDVSGHIAVDMLVYTKTDENR
jgi:membrane protein